MKKLLIPFLGALLMWAASCNKDIKDPVVTPADNTWIINETTFSPGGFIYYDTARLMMGGSARPKLSIVNIRFFSTPTENAKYVFRQVANEPNEISIEIIDSVHKVVYHSQDNDGKALKTEQYADIQVTNGKISVSFIDAFLKQDGTEDWGKVSLVAKP